MRAGLTFKSSFKLTLLSCCGAPWQASKDGDGMVWAGSDADLTAMGRYDFFAQTQTQSRA